MIILSFLLIVIPGCSKNPVNTEPQTQNQPQPETKPGPEKVVPPKKYIDKTPEAYEKEGFEWGQRLKKEARLPNDLNEELVKFLLWGADQEPGSRESNAYFYFHVDISLKEAFKRGFEKAFVSEEAELVLSPHITEAAGQIARQNTGLFEEDVKDYVSQQRKFRRRFRITFKKTVDIFKELIAEGSFADRESFEKNFKNQYTKLVEKYLEGTPYYLIDEKYKTSRYIPADFRSQKEYQWYRNDFYKSFFGVLKAEEMWKLVYHRGVFEVGRDMGRKFGDDLISRPKLVQWLQRTYRLLEQEKVQDGMDALSEGFKYEYGNFSKEAEQVWKDLIKEIKG